MRGAIGGLLRKPGCIGSSASSFSQPLSTAFSTSSNGGGSGRGRGRGAPVQSPFEQVQNQPENPNSSDGSPIPTRSAAPIPGRGHGRGNPLPSSPFLPSFNTFGLGATADEGAKEQPMPKKPVFFSRDDGEAREPVKPNSRRPIGEVNLPGSMFGALSGMGRGQALKGPEIVPQEVEENRHVRRREEVKRNEVNMPPRVEEASMEVESVEQRTYQPPKLSREEAKNKALNILSGDRHGGGSSSTESVGDSRGRSQEGGRGRGRGRGGGRGRWSGRKRGAFGRNQGDMEEDEEEEEDDGFFIGNEADAEKLAQRVGPKTMNMLTEAFEEVAHNTLPSVLEDEYLDAMDTNLKIELEPEYLMADFETNPDIHDKPPIPLREALEKMKPFLMVYEGIRSEEEWKEVMEDTMNRVPLIKQIVDHYAGPDTVTAKQQHKELKRVAKTLPASTPDSVKRFTDRAVLTLQSNPGWGFDKKCQFMDKLVAGVSQVYK